MSLVCNEVEICNLMAMQSVRPPCYSHFILARTKARSVIVLFKEPLSSSHHKIQLEFCGPLVTDQWGSTVFEHHI